MRDLALSICILSTSAVYAGDRAAVQARYEQAFEVLGAMLDCRVPPDLQKAVYTVENAYFDGLLDHDWFNERIDLYATLATIRMRGINISSYAASDSIQYKANAAVFKVMTDTTWLVVDDSLVGIPPFRYDMEDPFGNTDHSRQFVSGLLRTRTGNCHSLPLLYKILCDRLGGSAWLSLAPHHIYLKQHSLRHGWYNTELTSGTFPIDGWIMASGYISADAIRSGIYMDTLSMRGTIALCLTDLAMGYQRRFARGNESFILRCCAKVLQYFPHSISALLLKAEALSRIAGLERNEILHEEQMHELNATLSRLVDLGYRDVPSEVYLKWMNELSRQRSSSLYDPENKEQILPHAP